MSVSEVTRSLRSVTKQYVMPAEHGGWFLWIGPFLLGALAAATYNVQLVLLLALIMAVYLSRQPLIIMTKAVAGRRARSDLWPALRVFAVIAAIAAALLGLLVLGGNAFLLLLGLPAIPVLGIQLWLVSQRRERQIGIELIGSGVLALSATAAYWVSEGTSDATGWWLWILSWLYNASAIVYVYLRLKQRRWNTVPGWSIRWMVGVQALAAGAVNLVLTFVLARAGLVPGMTPVIFLLALAHFGYGVADPCVKVKPIRVGVEQSLATLAFFLLLALAFRF